MFGNLGFGELLLIGLIILLVFGAKRVPEIAQSLGKGIREFKKSMSDLTGELNSSIQPPPQQTQYPQPYQQPYAQPPQYVPPQQAAPAVPPPAPQQAAPGAPVQAQPGAAQGTQQS